MNNNEISYKILITEFVFVRFNPDLYDSSEFLLKINKD